MALSSIQEQRKNEIDKLDKEFKRRMLEIPESTATNVLDGGKTKEQEVVDWAKGEMEKINKKYGVI
jgi:hypothetical protein